MKSRIGLAIASVLVTLAVAVSAPPGHAAGDDDCAPDNSLTPEAEIFATNNTATITDPADPRLQDPLEQFESQVDGTIRANAAIPVGSDLVHGVFWSDDLQKTTYEPSRDFHVACVDSQDLSQIGEQIARRFNQESVLIFTDMREGDPAADSFIARVPDIDVVRFHDVLAAGKTARSHLGGGSITDNGILVLVASDADTALAQRVVARSGGHLDMSAVQHGESQFVSAT